MEFKDEAEVIAFIKKNQKVPTWVSKARENHKVLKALVTGEKFNEVLITKIEKIESEDRAEARLRYSKDIRDMFNRVMQPRTSIFNASGGSVHIDIASKTNKEKLIEQLTHFKGQKSIKKYLSENFFKLTDTDPNGLIFLEYFEDKDVFPTYKSITDIRNYKSNGQLLDFIIFEPVVKVIGKNSFQEWRIVDKKTDWRILQNGESYTLMVDKTFTHPFGEVPATIVSDINKMGSELRISPLYPIEELAKDYARDKSIKTIYKFQQGFPRHWRYEKVCRDCNGLGKDGTDSCKSCDGTGNLRRNDVTDVTIIDQPREDDPIITPNVEGFSSPDLATWERYNEDLKDNESLIDSTMWGTKRITQATNETATGRFIDVQPVMNKLDWFADNVEWVHNQLANWIENWINGQPKEKSEYHIAYGRRFIIESPDVILDKYNEAREKGANSTILDKLMDEYLLSKYQNNPILLDQNQKKRIVEPYIHESIDQVFEMFGNIEANKIVLFVDFWEIADTSKTSQELKTEFNTYFTANNTIKPVVIEPTE